MKQGTETLLYVIPCIGLLMEAQLNDDVSLKGRTILLVGTPAGYSSGFTACGHILVILRRILCLCSQL